MRWHRELPAVYVYKMLINLKIYCPFLNDLLRKPIKILRFLQKLYHFLAKIV